MLLLGACTTNEMAKIEPPTPPETFAMLPDSVVSVPFARDAQAPKLVRTVAALTEPGIEPVGYVSSGSMRVPAVSQNPEVDRLITTYAASYEVPESLVRRVVKRESNFRPEARNGPYWGLMQILPATARGMGFDGKPSDLLDAETNLKYAVKYLKGAYLVAGGDHDMAVRNYARGYYYDAKRKGLLEETGLKARSRMPDTLVASAGTATPSATGGSAQLIASQWETGFVTATSGRAGSIGGVPAGGAGKTAVQPAASKTSARTVAMESSGAQMGGVGEPADAAGLGLGPAGATSTPSLGMSVQ